MWMVLKILRGLIRNNVPGMEGTVEFFMGFDKLNMEGGVDFLSSMMVAAVSFRIRAVTQKNTFNGARFDLWVVVLLDENESMATNFAKMREIWFAPIICLKWGHEMQKRPSDGPVQHGHYELRRMAP
ncbi:hypothetical protein NEOLEDRAFT_1152571 [Neolentinus lepideus HHB14362 ss-1]|uniref:Uncharacterized protein n=1 Tax=Neolentinus lepideus HHB14362 ss-1 TaxID=1314782 RepID=A0A165MMG1_9AGAM|nr:hypothetical protein NEOLEDRAFT_1152571 [Neolentinus lepideus HHB14362 ss-1]